MNIDPISLFSFGLLGDQPPQVIALKGPDGKPNGLFVDAEGNPVDKNGKPIKPADALTAKEKKELDMADAEAKAKAKGAAEIAKREADARAAALLAKVNPTNGTPTTTA